MKTIELKMSKNLGTAKGTLGWFHNLKKEVVITNNSKGIPCVWLEYQDNEKKITTFIAKINNTSDFDGVYYREIGRCLAVYPNHNEYAHQAGLFNFALTPATEEAVEELIIKAVEKFEEWWDNN